MIVRKRLTFLCVVVALAAGQLAPACADCCPAADSPAALAAAHGCCGDCAPTVERPAEPASLAAKAAVPAPFAAIVSLVTPLRTLVADAVGRPALASSLLRFAPLEPPRPLRL
jgi:hypothetical protein